MTEREKQILRVKAMLAQTTDRGATPEEAMVFAAKAAKIMDEHSISLSEVSNAGADRFGRRILSPKERWKAEFLGWIGFHVGKFTGTVSLSQKASNARMYINSIYFGVESDVIFAEWLAKMLGDFVFEGYRVSRMLHRPKGREEVKSHRDGYMLGAARAINARLRQLTADRVGNAASRNALTVLDKWQAALNEASKTANGETQVRQVTGADAVAFAEGTQRGESAPFNKPITDADKPLMIAAR